MASFLVRRVEVDPHGNGFVSVDLGIDASDCISEFGEGEFLEIIGKERCMQHFDLVEEKN